MVADLHRGVATNSQIQWKEEKALWLASRSPCRISIRQVEIRETPPPQPVPSVPVRLAIDRDLQSACPEFESSERDLLLLANPVSRFGLSLLLWRRISIHSRTRRPPSP